MHGERRMWALSADTYGATSCSIVGKADVLFLIAATRHADGHGMSIAKIELSEKINWASWSSLKPISIKYTGVLRAAAP